ncbi:MAG TPA: sigma-70 family RNA polymerase sigma factor [Candidatus Eremiobacteraceae bacterium]|nr:sigma-70 family RNA polymerase sigma factor [Candidatus Eremiobacteraceae bacterium]
MADEALVALVLGGDPNAFAPLVERHKRGVVNFIHASVRSVEDANDLGQETFMRAYAHLRTFNPSIAKFSTWLYQIARNVARTHLAKEMKRPQTEDLFEDETLEQRLPDTRREAAPEAMALAADDDRTVRDALGDIPERMRTALALRYFKHMEYQEIADTMQVSLGNVKTLIHRGKAALAKALDVAETRAAAASSQPLRTEVRSRELLCM